MKPDALPSTNTALAMFPSVEGFGWMLFDGPLSPVDWGICTLADRPGTPEEKNARCMKKIEALLSGYRPAAIVLEAFEGPGTRRHERIRQFCRAIISFATMNGVPVRIISRAQITSCFESTQPKTRYAIATTVALYLKEIRHLLPNKRRAWETEDSEMALFNATALLIVHYARPAKSLGVAMCS